MIPIIEEMMQEIAYATYYIHWDEENTCDSPAFYLFDEFSPISPDGKCVLKMADIKTWQFDKIKDAEIFLGKFFASAKDDRSGYLYKKYNGKLKIFAKKPKREHKEITFVSNLTVHSKCIGDNTHE